MTVTIETNDNTRDYPMTDTRVFRNIWEIQDNGHNELVLKRNDHTCIRIKEAEITRIEVEL